MATASFGIGARVVGGEITVNTAQHRNQFEAKVVRLADGNLIIVWIDDDRGETGTGGDSSGYAIKGQLVDPDGNKIGSEILINSSTSGDQAPKEVFALPNGGFAVLWTTAPDTAAPTSVAPVLRAFTASGAAATGEVFVASPTSASNAPQFVQLPNGNIAVSYSGGRTTIYDQSLNQVDAIDPGVSAGMTSRDLVVLNDGGVAVMWSSGQSGPNYRYYDSNFDAAGPSASMAVVVPLNPTLASVGLSDGNILVVYPVGTSSGSINAMVLSPTGAVSNVPIGFTGSGATGLRVGSVITLADGKVLATYTDAGNGSARLFNADGSVFGPSFGPAFASGAQAWALPEGGFIITRVAGGSLYGQAYTADGAPIGAEAVIDVGANADVQIEVLADGGLMAIWTDTDLGGADTEIHAQRLGPVTPRATEQTALSLKAFDMTVGDTSSGVVTVTLSVAYGVLNATPGTSGAIVSGNGGSTLTITGTVGQINALLRTDATSTVTYTPDTNAPPAAATLTLNISGDQTATATTTIYIAAIDDPGVATDDAATTNEGVSVTIAALANDDPDGGSTITNIAGVPVVAGDWVLLASGARARLNADGTLTWDPNAAFDGLAAGGSTNDSFTYTISGGTSAIATVAVGGLDSISSDDTFNLDGGGAASVSGGRGDDGFNFWAEFDADDFVDGGDGAADQVGIGGDYAGAGALTLTGSMMTNVERLVLLPGAGNRYAITTTDDLLSGQQTVIMHGADLGPDNAFEFDGSAESSGGFVVLGGFGADTFTGGGGIDHFLFTAGRFDPGTDHVDGGAGFGDQITLEGSYTLTLDATSLTSVEVIALRSIPAEGPSTFVLTLANNLTPAGGHLTIYGLPVSGSILVDGQAETDAHLRIYGGLNNDTLFGGDQDDWLYGGEGADALYGSGGSDVFAYTTTSESTGANHDRVFWFDPDVDHIDLPQTVTGIAPTVQGGALSAVSFNPDLETAIGADELGIGNAVLFRPTEGALAGSTFLVVDANGIAGYQADQDYVFELLHPPGAITLDAFS